MSARSLSGTVRRRAVPLALLCAAGAAALSPARAAGDVFGPISLVSEGVVAGAPGGEVEQAEYAHDTAIAGNGRFIAFDGSFHGVTGVWRAELQNGRVTGAIEQVAGGDAELPSISESGQYVSFTTNEGASLPEITYGLHGEAPEQREGIQEAANVYVRDMDAGREGEEGRFGAQAFKVASAANGSDEPLSYREAGTEHGAQAVGRSAISANGNEVAFVTTAVSNLLDPGEANTPALQVAVRYMASGETRLVSASRQGGPVSAQEAGRTFGAVFPDDNGGPYGFKPPAVYAAGMPPPGASISADGSTVAWMGTSIEQQAPLLANERTVADDVTEPLWRRIEPGSETPTERVTGGSDPANPACVASGETQLPTTPSPTDPCQGPFDEQVGDPWGGIWIVGELGDPVPRLSADGYTVAFMSRAPLATAGENFGLGASGQDSDLYIADMHPGLTRDQALTRLTELAGGPTAPLEETAPIYDFEISPDASQVAFATRRTQFPLGSPALVTPPAGEAGMNELFDADLADGTLTRVSHGYEGPDQPSEALHPLQLAGEDPYDAHEGDGAFSPSFSDDGDSLAFASTASNLVFGDGNTPPAGPQDGSDAYVVERLQFQAQPTPEYFSPAPQVATQPRWLLGATALSRADGSVVLYVRTPGPGTLRASAQSWVHVRVRGARARRARSRRPGHAAKTRQLVALRTVASAARDGSAPAGELTTIVLRLAKPYQALASQKGGLSAALAVAFAAAGEPALRASLTVAFVRTAKPAHRSHKAAARARRHGKRRSR